MAIVCTPSELADLSKCFMCLTPGQRAVAQTYVLAVLAGASTDPAVLMEEAKCFSCLTPKQLKLLQPYLMCLIAGGVAPPTPGECFVQTTPTGYESTNLGIFSYAGMGPVTEITYLPESNNEGIDIEAGDDLVTISAPNLVSLDPAAISGVGIYLDSLPSLTTLSLPLLETCYSLTVGSAPSFTTLTVPVLSQSQSGIILNNTGIVSLSLPAYTSGGINCTNDASLQTVSIPVYSPDNGAFINLTGCNLSAASVNHILARCVANPAFISGTVDLSGGTSSAPSGQGIVDANTLTVRGVTVTTN